MMNEFQLSWGRVNEHRGDVSEPMWRDIEIALDQLKSHRGTVTLSMKRQNEGPDHLSLHSDSGKYLLMLSEDTGDDVDVRTVTAANAPDGRVEVLGDLWSSKMVTSDFDVVIRVFKEFFETGDVSRDLMS